MEVSAPPRPVEPRPPAATCGPPSRPQCPRPSVKPPSKIKTTRQVDHTPVGPKHLKSVVLPRQVVAGIHQPGPRAVAVDDVRRNGDAWPVEVAVVRQFAPRRPSYPRQPGECHR